jgi:hypothetical protein
MNYKRKGKEMKRFLTATIVICLSLFVAGCFGKSTRVTTLTDGTVVTEEMTNEAAFYELQKMQYAAEQASAQPIAVFEPNDGPKVTIYNQIQKQVPRPVQASNAFVDWTDKVVNSTPLAIFTAGWSVKSILQNARGDINASGGSNVTSTSNSHNATDLRNADTLTEDNSNNSINDSYNQTADPTVVTQPEYNDPIVIEQPPYNDPMVIERPPYNDPIVIEQPIIPGGE